MVEAIENIGATGAGLRDHDQAIGRNGVDPAAEPVSCEVPRTRIRFQVIKPRVSRTEQEQVVTTREHAAVMSRTHHAPGDFLSGQWMNTHVLVPGVQVESPWLSDNSIAHDNRAVLP